MIYAFGVYELDTTRHELRHKGVPYPLEPQVFAVLHYLIEHRDRVVSKQDLLDHVWPDTFVSESALYQRLRAARQAIGDSGRAQRVIKTVHKQGYRFSSLIVEQESSANRVEHIAVSAMPQLPTDIEVPETILPPPQASLPVDRAPVIERKLVTVLCGTLANAEVLAESLGFDALQHLTQTFITQAEVEVARYEGILLAYGDTGFFALFGAPVSHEDHPRRAVLTALGIRQRLNDAHAELDIPQDMHPMVRIGVHTGLVRLSESETGRFGPLMGETMELAVRLQSLAGAGKILVSEATLQLVQGEVVSEPYGLVRGREASASLMAYTVDALGAWHPLLHQHGRRVLSPFVGRQDELSVIERSLTQAVEGQGQVVGLMGDPGMGKSRFLYEFARRLAKQPVTYVEGHCLSYGSTTPYLPLPGVLRQLSGITEADGPESMRTKVHDYLEAVSLEPASAAPFLFELLGLAVDTETLAGLTPKVIKERTFDALLRLSLQSSQRQPLVMAVENLHWIDPTSEEWLTSLVEYLPSAPLLLLTTYRPGYRPLWMDKSYATQLALSRLTPQDSRALIESVLQTERLPEILVQEILTKAGGNPFFLEELSRAVVERGAQGAALQVPDTVQTVLAARIDRLSVDDKRLLQIASVIGKDVPVSILQAVAEVPETVVEHNLTHLQRGEFLHEIQRDPEKIYTFKHALTQDVAYQSLLQRTRQQYHQQVAQVLEAKFPDLKEMQPELLAHHYTEADLSDQALVYWHQAARKASERAAYAEAISHVRKGLEVLRSLPDVPERAQQEIISQLLLGDALQVTRGYTYPEVGHTYARARELCQQVGPTPHLSTVLLGLMRFGSNRGDLQTGHELAEQHLSLAQRQQDSPLLVTTHYMMGVDLFMRGEFTTSLSHFEQSIALYNPQQYRAHTFHSGNDPGVTTLTWMAHILWILGYPDQSLEKGHAALSLARKLLHPYSLAWAMNRAAFLHRIRREEHSAQEKIKALVALSTELELAYRSTSIPILQGWTLAVQQRREDGVAQLRQGLDAYRNGGAVLYLSWHLALLAEAYQAVGRIEEGLRALAEALTHIDKIGEGFYEAEIYRLRGELLRAANNHTEANTCFQQALDIARKQHAKSWELRAAMSLARLWQSQGKRQDAYALLAPLYNWCTEGFDTADLQEARALLAALS